MALTKVKANGKVGNSDDDDDEVRGFPPGHPGWPPPPRADPNSICVD